MGCDCNFSIKISLVKNYLVPSMLDKKTGRTIPEFKLLKDSFSVCWYCSPIFCPEDARIRIDTLAKNTLNIFAGILLDAMGAYHQHPYPQDSLKRTIAFFLEPFKKRMSPLMRIACTVFDISSSSKLAPDSIKQIRLNLIDKITRIVFRQHLFDPLEYVSHGFDHSLNVADIATEKIAKGTSVHTPLLAQLGPHIEHNTVVLNAIVELLAYLHDCGYPHLHARAKANHAMHSADLVDQLKDDLEKIIGSEIYKALRKAIFTHNADEKSDKFTAMHTTSSGEYLSDGQHIRLIEDFLKMNEIPMRKARILEGNWTPGDYVGRKLDLFFPKDGLIGSECLPAFLHLDPLGFIIRIADNLDFTNSRFNWIQEKQSFKSLYRYRHLIRRCEEKIKSHEKIALNLPVTYQTACTSPLIHLLIHSYKVLIAMYKESCDNLLKTDSDLKLVAHNVDEFSFRHFGGCEAIETLEDFELLTNGNECTVVIGIKISKERWLDLEKFSVEEIENIVTISKYQLFRTWVAFHQISSSTNEVDKKKLPYPSSLAPNLKFALRIEGNSEIFIPNDIFLSRP